MNYGYQPGYMPGYYQQPMDQLVHRFKQFQREFQGDPKAEVMNLLQSGAMSQWQLNQLQQMASQFQVLLK